MPSPWPAPWYRPPSKLLHPAPIGRARRAEPLAEEPVPRYQRLPPCTMIVPQSLRVLPLLLASQLDRRQAICCADDTVSCANTSQKCIQLHIYLWDCEPRAVGRSDAQLRARLGLRPRLRAIVSFRARAGYQAPRSARSWPARSAGPCTSCTWPLHHLAHHCDLDHAPPAPPAPPTASCGPPDA